MVLVVVVERLYLGSPSGRRSRGRSSAALRLRGVWVVSRPIFACGFSSDLQKAIQSGAVLMLWRVSRRSQERCFAGPFPFGLLHEPVPKMVVDVQIADL